jgi:hypothetical protein
MSLASPVTFSVTPLTICDALIQEVITPAQFSQEDQHSPNRAGIVCVSPSATINFIVSADIEDFSTNVIEVTFFPDEGLPPRITVSACILLNDDEKNEARKKFFIAHVEIKEALNFDLIGVTRTVSTCTIIDNDGESVSGKTENAP